jgi:hypothetical protein
MVIAANVIALEPISFNSYAFYCGMLREQTDTPKKRKIGIDL